MRWVALIYTPHGSRWRKQDVEYGALCDFLNYHPQKGREIRRVVLYDEDCQLNEMMKEYRQIDVSPEITVHIQREEKQQ